MLFRLGLQSRSQIDVLLEKYAQQQANNTEDTNASSGTTITLQQLMDDDDFLHETKVHNEKLFHFLTQEHILLQIINFFIEIPQNPDENDSRNEQFVKRVHKYPSLAFHVFQNYPEIYTHIAASPRLLQALFSYLNDSTSPDQLRYHSLWLKIMTRLLEQQPEAVFQFIMSRENDFILTQIFSHVTMDKMTDFMLKLFMCDNFDWEQEQNMFQTPLRKFMLQSKMQSSLGQRKKRDDSGAGGAASTAAPSPTLSYNRIGEFWIEQNVLERCLALMRPEYDIDIHTIVQYLLTSILKRSIQFVQPSKQLSKLNPLAQKLLSVDFLDTYIRNLMNYENTTVMSCGVDFLSCLISLSTSNPALGTPQLQTAQKTPIPMWPISLHDCVMYIAAQLPSFVRILENPAQITPARVITTFGTLEPPLGETRLKVIDFLSTLFLSPLSEISAQLVKCNVLGVITDLFFLYEFNSLLHNQFLKIISFILSRDHLDLKRALFQDCKIVERILAAHRLNEEACSKPRGVRKGYMGHLIIISNTIVTTAKSQREIQDMIHDKSEEWQVFVENDLAERNLIQTTTLGGSHPLSSNSDIDDHFKGFDDEMDEEDDFHSGGVPGGKLIQAPVFLSSGRAGDDDDEAGGEDSSDDDSDSDSSDEDDTIIRRRDEHLRSDDDVEERDGSEGEEAEGTATEQQDTTNQSTTSAPHPTESIYTDFHFWDNSSDLNAFDFKL